MDMTAPFAPLFSPTTGALLRTLAGTTKPLTGREAARIAQVNPSTAWATLAKLTEAGILEEQQAGRATLFLFNRDHVAATPLLELLRMRERLFDQIRQRIQDWQLQPLHVSVFGSTARGDGDSNSDIDLLVIRPDGVRPEDERWRAQLDNLAEAITRWSGNHAGLAELDRAGIRAILAERNPIERNLQRDAVLLLGTSLQELSSK